MQDIIVHAQLPLLVHYVYGMITTTGLNLHNYIVLASPPPQDTDVVIPLASEFAAPFTGRGLISLPVAGSAIFTVEVPEDSQYEVIIRYQVSDCQQSRVYVGRLVQKLMGAMTALEVELIRVKLT